MNGERVAMKVYDYQAGWYFFVNDHLGTPQKIVNEAGEVVWAGFYQPFGKSWAYPADITNNFRLPGQYYDAETGLNYNWHRYYDPDTGRYLTPDPIGLDGGINLYAYVMGNPVNSIDPNGLDPIDYNTGESSEVMGCHHTHKLTEEDMAILMMLFDIADIPSGEGIIPGIYMILGEKFIRFGKLKVFAEEFHRVIKPEILKKAGKYQKIVGDNPDIKIVGDKVHLTGTGPFKGKTFKTDLKAADFFK